jgi:hypothetical protein
MAVWKHIPDSHLLKIENFVQKIRQQCLRSDSLLAQSAQINYF